MKFDKNKYKIVNRQNKHTNISSRHGFAPMGICNHLSGGTFKSMDNWFRDPTNNGSSADFGVAKDGRIYMWGDSDFTRKTWANGLTSGIDECTSELVREKYYDKVNPCYNSNDILISIEHEGTDGVLTDAQYQATLWIHQWIQMTVKEKYGFEIPFNRKHIIGHREVDKDKKYYCPGEFPFERLLEDLNKDSEITAERYVMTLDLYNKIIEVDGILVKDGEFNIGLRNLFEDHLDSVVDYDPSTGLVKIRKNETCNAIGKEVSDE